MCVHLCGSNTQNCLEEYLSKKGWLEDNHQLGLNSNEGTLEETFETKKEIILKELWRKHKNLWQEEIE